jgi:hypothetical protein
MHYICNTQSRTVATRAASASLGLRPSRSCAARLPARHEVGPQERGNRASVAAVPTTAPMHSPTANPIREPARSSRGSSRWSLGASRESRSSRNSAAELTKARLDEPLFEAGAAAEAEDRVGRAPAATFEVDVECGGAVCSSSKVGSAAAPSLRYGPTWKGDVGDPNNVRQCPEVSHDCPETTLFLLFVVATFIWWAELTFQKHAAADGSQAG